MGDPSGYWTWDEISQDYYHDQPGKSYFFVSIVHYTNPHCGEGLDN